MSQHLKQIAPGLILSLALAGAADGLQMAEQALTGRSVLEALVIAILLGVATRTIWLLGPNWTPGIRFSSHTILEFAVMLLGASISFQQIEASGVKLILVVTAAVIMSIAASYGVCRTLKLPHRLSVLIACGNSICGSSAIAAVAPVIEAEPKDITASIAFTAIIGVAMVLGLPIVGPALGLTKYQYGVFAGMTVYAVPQVLAATLPLGVLSMQMGTVVKLMRIMMLGPVLLGLSAVTARGGRGREEAANHGKRRTSSLGTIAPWFIIGFAALAGARSAGVIPQATEAPIMAMANFLTVVSMAALGLAVDVRQLARAGARVTSAVAISILILGAISLAMIRAVGIH